MSRIIKPIIITIIAIMFLLATHYISWLKPVENLLVQIISPVQGVFYGASNGLGSSYKNWIGKRDLIGENQRLGDELVTCQVNQSKINSLQAENALLKSELEFIDEYKINFVSARIISGVSDQASQTIVINKGRDNGILKGMAVAVGDGVMVGKVQEVSGNFSKVLLLTDNQSKVAATVQNQDRTAGLVEGQFGLSFVMTHIPQNQEMVEGDFVVTSGLEGLVPKDLLIASIDSIHSVESEIFKSATLRPIISFDDLSYVLVLIP